MYKGVEMINKMLELAHSDEAVFPPTILYNEGWMLRVLLSLQSEGIECLPFTFQPGARWFSEAMIGSPFLPRIQKDPLAEGYTHLDGAIGHFDIRPGTKAGLELRADSKQFVAIEAKMFSTLSKGTTHAPNYDQATRIVACIAWAIKQANRTAEDFESLGFYVFAPSDQINRDVFSSQVNKYSIKHKVNHRIKAYAVDEKKYAELKTWQKNFFLPVLEHIDIRCIPWETIIDKIDDPDIRSFYSRCILFNT